MELYTAIAALMFTNLVLAGVLACVLIQSSREKKDLLDRLMARDFEAYYAKQQDEIAQVQEAERAQEVARLEAKKKVADVEASGVLPEGAY